MSPIDIVRVLTAAAPIVASVASVANKAENIEKERKDTPCITNNISITTNNYFYTKPGIDDINIANKMQSDLLNSISSGTRYTL